MSIIKNETNITREVYQFHSELVKESTDIGRLHLLFYEIRRDCESCHWDKSFNPDTGEMLFSISGVLVEVNRGSNTSHFLTTMFGKYDIQLKIAE